MNDDSIARMLSQKEFNLRLVHSECERKEFFDFLEHKRINSSGLNRYEYNYLCFTVFKHAFKTDASLPIVPAIKEISFDFFVEQFGQGQVRSELINSLRFAAKECRASYDLEAEKLVYLVHSNRRAEQHNTFRL